MFMTNITVLNENKIYSHCLRYGFVFILSQYVHLVWQCSEPVEDLLAYTGLWPAPWNKTVPRPVKWLGGLKHLCKSDRVQFPEP